MASYRSNENSSSKEKKLNLSDTPKYSKLRILAFKLERIVLNKERTHFQMIQDQIHSAKIEELENSIELAIIDYNFLKNEISGIYKDFSSSYNQFKGAKEDLQHKKDEFRAVIKKMSKIIQIRRYRTILKDMFSHFKTKYDSRAKRVHNFKSGSQKRLKISPFFKKLQVYAKNKIIKKKFKKIQ